MASKKELTSQVDLGDFIEATLTAVERASNGKRVMRPGAAVGIIFQPPHTNGHSDPSQSELLKFAEAIASNAGELHGKFVQDALDKRESREQRFQQSLTTMIDLGIMTDGEASLISDLRLSVRDNARSLAASHREVKSALEILRTSEKTNPVALSIVGVYADSLARETETTGPRPTARAAAKSKGIAGADGEGAVAGGGFGGLIGAELGGIGGAILGSVIGAVAGAAIQSIGAALSDDDDD